MGWRRWKDVPRMLHVPRLLPPPPPPRRRHPLNNMLNSRCTRRPLRQACLPPSHPARTPARRQCRWHVARFKSQEAPNRPPSNEGYDWRGAWETATPGEPLGSCWTLAAICSDLSRATCHLPSRGLAWQRPHLGYTPAQRRRRRRAAAWEVGTVLRHATPTSSATSTAAASPLAIAVSVPATAIASVTPFAGGR